MSESNIVAEKQHSGLARPAGFGGRNATTIGGRKPGTYGPRSKTTFDSDVPEEIVDLLTSVRNELKTVEKQQTDIQTSISDGWYEEIHRWLPYLLALLLAFKSDLIDFLLS